MNFVNNFDIQLFDQVNVQTDKLDQVYGLERGCLNDSEASGIKPTDISIVVQGAVNTNYTLRCLKSIRACLPDSKIILSTWKGSDLSCLVSFCGLKCTTFLRFKVHHPEEVFLSILLARFVERDL
jgi:hypothetical protein